MSNSSLIYINLVKKIDWLKYDIFGRKYKKITFILKYNNLNFQNYLLKFK